MSTEKTQSAIDEVRDQMSLDFADGQYLKIVTANLGLARPRTGFTDDAWRAVGRAIALNYKQILTKFEEILGIVFGPKITASTSMSQDALVGDKWIFVDNPEEFPQLGTIVIDEGQATEETLGYCFVDRFRNQVFLREPLGFAHTAAAADGEQSLFVVDANNPDILLVPDASVFPNPSPFVPYTIVVGPGTSAEETAVVTAVNTVANKLTLSAPLSNTHEAIVPGAIRTILDISYAPSTNILVLDDATQFPDSGSLLLQPAGPGFSPTADSFTVDAGSSAVAVKVVAFNNPPDPVPLVPHGFDADEQGGNVIVFDDDTTTAALRGVEAVIVDNTGDTLNVASTLPAVPAAGDTFKIRPRVFYTSLDQDTNTATLRTFIRNLTVEKSITKHSDTVAGGATDTVIPLTTGGLSPNEFRGLDVIIAGDLTTVVSHTAGTLTVSPALPVAPPAAATVQIIAENTVELLEAQATVQVAQVKSPGKGWDVIQVDKDHVEVFLPDDSFDEQDIRSASYIHTIFDAGAPSDSLDSAATAGDTEFEVSDPSAFPIVGVVTLDPGGGNEENVPYSNTEVAVIDGVLVGDTVAAAGSTVSSVELTTGGLTPNEHNNRRVFVGGKIRRIVDHDANTINFEPPLTVVPTPGTLVQVRDTSLPVGSTSLVVNNAVDLPSSGDVILGSGLGTQETVTISAKDDATRIVTISATANAHRIGESLRDIRFIIPNDLELANSHGGGTTVNLYQPDHPATALLNGNLWSIEDVFPGPYVYLPLNPAPNLGQALEELVDLLAGETKVVLDQVAGATAIEVQNATAFPLSGFPYNARIGENTGNREGLIVNDVGLKQRVSTTVPAGPVIPAGSTSLNVVDITSTSGGPGSSIADSFPQASAYRVLVDKGGANEEVLYVKGIAAAPNRLLLVDPTARAHNPGESVELMADVLTVVATTDAHEGIVSQAQRSSQITGDPVGSDKARWPQIQSFDIETAEIVNVEYSEATLSSGTGFPTEGGRVILNFGNIFDDVDTILDTAATALDTSIDVPDGTLFADDFPFVITISPGSLVEEVVLVTGKTGLNTLDLASELRFNHPLGAPVEQKASEEQVLTYSSVSGNDLSFSSPIVLQLTHSPGETAIVSLVESEPKDNGYDFLLKLPFDPTEALRALLDLVRAAGVEVTFIDKR